MTFVTRAQPLIDALEQVLSELHVPYALAVQVDGESLDYTMSLPPDGCKSMIFVVTRDKNGKVSSDVQFIRDALKLDAVLDDGNYSVASYDGAAVKFPLEDTQEET